jgi:hypothetical protein
MPIIFNQDALTAGHNLSSQPRAYRKPCSERHIRFPMQRPQQITLIEHLPVPAGLSIQQAHRQLECPSDHLIWFVLCDHLE